MPIIPRAGGGSGAGSAERLASSEANASSNAKAPSPENIELRKREAVLKSLLECMK